MGPDSRVRDALLGRLATDSGASVGALVDGVSREERVPRHRVARSVQGLLEEGRVKIEGPAPSTDIISGFYSLRNLKFLALLTVPIIAGLTILSPQAGAVYYVRVVLGGLAVLFLPGYGAVKSLYPGREMTGLQVGVYSSSISLALIPLVGVVLNYSPWGIGLESTFVSFFLIDVLLLFLASVRSLRA